MIVRRTEDHVQFKSYVFEKRRVSTAMCADSTTDEAIALLKEVLAAHCSFCNQAALTRCVRYQYDRVEKPTACS